jgi:hypothetical protein
VAGLLLSATRERNRPCYETLHRGSHKYTYTNEWIFATRMELYKEGEVLRTCVEGERRKLPKILLNYKPKTERK